MQHIVDPQNCRVAVGYRYITTGPFVLWSALQLSQKSTCNMKHTLDSGEMSIIQLHSACSVHCGVPVCANVPHHGPQAFRYLWQRPSVSLCCSSARMVVVGCRVDSFKFAWRSASFTQCGRCHSERPNPSPLTNNSISGVVGGELLSRFVLLSAQRPNNLTQVPCAIAIWEYVVAPGSLRRQHGQCAILQYPPWTFAVEKGCARLHPGCDLSEHGCTFDEQSKLPCARLVLPSIACRCSASVQYEDVVNPMLVLLWQTAVKVNLFEGPMQLVPADARARDPGPAGTCKLQCMLLQVLSLRNFRYSLFSINRHFACIKKFGVWWHVTMVTRHLILHHAQITLHRK